MNMTLTIQMGNEEPVVFKASIPGHEPRTPDKDEVRVRKPPYFIPVGTCINEPVLVESPKLVHFR